VLCVEAKDVGRSKTQAERDGDDSARRGSSDQVEVVGDSNAEVLLDRGQDGGREHAADAAAVERQDLKALTIRRCRG
jgi:hypothetical protein